MSLADIHLVIVRHYSNNIMVNYFRWLFTNFIPGPNRAIYVLSEYTMHKCDIKLIVALHVANMSVPRDYLAIVYHDIDRIFTHTIDAHHLYRVHTVAYVTVL